MKVLNAANEAATVELSALELLAASNALNEVLHGVDIPDFQARLGVSRVQAEALLDEFGRLLDRVTSSPPARGWR